VERPVGFSEDDRLPEYGLGLTNIAERPTRGSGDLSREDFESGRIKLLRKIRRFRPEVVAFVGVIAYRACFHARGRVQCGLARERIAFSRVFVLPNTSGRNAHTGYSEMLKLFKELRQEAGA
jgi:TDG/mug DNA glycosylase family protein